MYFLVMCGKCDARNLEFKVGIDLEDVNKHILKGKNTCYINLEKVETKVLNVTVISCYRHLRSIHRSTAVALPVLCRQQSPAGRCDAMQAFGIANREAYCTCRKGSDQ